MATVWAVVGALLGALLLEGIQGAIVGGALGWLLATVSELKRELAQLRASTQTAPERPVEFPAQPAQGEAAQPQPELLPQVSASAPEGEPTPVAPPKAPSALGTLLQRALSRVVHFFTTGNIVLRVGLVVLFFGVAFLLKYAAEQALLPIELRLAAVALGGAAMVGGGFRLRRREHLYGVLLQGGGIGVLYLTVFTALRLYDLLPATLAFGLLVVLVAASCALAVLQDARGLAAFGTAGGFLAPVLTSTGEGSHVALFSYYALLNAGILGIAFFRSWRELNLIGFVFTFVIGAAWGYSSYRPEHFASTEPFLVLFFLFFLAIPVLFAQRQPPRLKGYVDGTLVFGVPLVAFGLQAAMLDDQPLLLAYSAVAMAAVYVGLTYALWRREALRALAEAFLALAVVFLTLAVPLALDGHWTAVTWALEGAGLIWLGCRQNRWLARLSGVLLQFGAGVSFALALLLSSGWGDWPVLNGRYLGCAVLSLAALLSGWLLQRRTLHRLEAAYAPLLLIWGVLWWLGGGLAEIDRQLPAPWTGTAAMLYFTGSAVAWGVAAKRWRWPALALPAAGLWPLFLLGALVLLSDNAGGHYFVDYGWLGWATFFAAQVFLLRLKAWPQGWQAPSHAGTLWLLVLVLSVELGWLARELGDGLFPRAWTLAAWGAVPALALLLVSSSRVEKLPLLSQAPSTYRRLGLAPIAGVGLLWFLAACTQAGDPAPLPYVPLLNPVDLAQALLLLAVWNWWRSHGRVMAPELGVWPDRGLALAAFVALNTVLARAVHHVLGVAYELPALIDAPAWQTALAMAWSLVALGLMWQARTRMSRSLWITGAVLLAAVVAKLFLVDLDGSGTVARIVSFLGVGLLMLLIGYMAPLPPRRQSEGA